MYIKHLSYCWKFRIVIGPFDYSLFFKLIRFPVILWYIITGFILIAIKAIVRSLIFNFLDNKVRHFLGLLSQSFKLLLFIITLFLQCSFNQLNTSLIINQLKIFNCLSNVWFSLSFYLMVEIIHLSDVMLALNVSYYEH